MPLSPAGPPGVQYENALLQIAPVDKAKCPFVKHHADITFQLFTRSVQPWSPGALEASTRHKL